jgi:hypothetical protein
MSGMNPTKLPATMAVLGVVIEQPEQTVAQIARTVSVRFTRSGIGGSAPYQALRQMAKGRSPRVRCTYEAAAEQRTMDRYAATERGIAVFRSWMLAPPAVPAIREAMYGRIELARLEHLPGLIRVAREEELIAIDLYETASDQVRRMRRKDRLRPKTAAEFERAIHQILVLVDPLWWSSRAAVFVSIREQLEEIAEEAGAEFQVPARHRMVLGDSDV